MSQVEGAGTKPLPVLGTHRGPGREWEAGGTRRGQCLQAGSRRSELVLWVAFRPMGGKAFHLSPGRWPRCPYGLG